MYFLHFSGIKEKKMSSFLDEKYTTTGSQNKRCTK